MRIFATLFAFSCLLVPASADPFDYNRTVAFGDSLSDNGNLTENVPSFLNPASAPGYFKGRFSNGPTWVELLSNPAKSAGPDGSMSRFWNGFFFSPPFAPGDGSNNVNVAIGGAETDSGLVPSIPTQIETFLDAGGAFGPDDLVSMQGGANDLFNFLSGEPDAPRKEIAAFATKIGENAAASVKAVMDTGATTILVSNLPDIGATPALGSTARTAQAGRFATQAYNDALAKAIRDLAGGSAAVNIVQMDWSSALDMILQRPAAFGFTDISTPCLAGGKICAAPDNHVFWDFVHPTAPAHALLARYAGLLLSTEQTGAALASLAQMTLSMRLEAGDILFRRALAADPQESAGAYVEGVGMFGKASGGTTRLLGNRDLDYELGGMRAGFDASGETFAVGAAAALQAGNARGRLLHADVRTVQLDAYALARGAFLFAGIEGGVSFNEFDDLRRATGFPSLAATGATNSTDYTIAATLGGEFQLGEISLTPAARIGYASLSMDGFTEAAPILALRYSRHDVRTGLWSARLRASMPLPRLSSVTVHAEAGYERLFSTDAGYTAKLAGNTARPVRVEDSLHARGLYLKAGLAGTVGDALTLSGEYGISMQRSDAIVHSARVGLTLRF